jgi:hypothetical protein
MSERSVSLLGKSLACALERLMRGEETRTTLVFSGGVGESPFYRIVNTLL